MADLIYTGRAHAIIQDAGRFGFKKYGVPESGFFDFQSAAKANWLAGNSWNSPVIETYFTGFSLKATTAVQIGVCGAVSHVRIDDVLYQVNETILLKPGQELSLSTLAGGYITYVAVQGRYTGKETLGSSSTFLPSAFGNSPLEKDQPLPFHVDSLKTKHRVLPQKWKRFIASECKVRVVKGPEAQFFDEDSLNLFTTTSYEVTRESSRMGYQLSGGKLKRVLEAEIASVPVAKGVIQINNAGLPMVLMPDAQTTGGYPRIGSIIQVDLDDIAQLPPGGKVRFEWIGLKEAQALLINYRNRFGINA